MCFEKVPCMTIYIVKMGVWNSSQMMWDLFQTSIFNVENLSFIVSRTLHVHVSLGLRAHASWLRAQVDSCVHKVGSSLALLFKK